MALVVSQRWPAPFTKATDACGFRKVGFGSKTVPLTRAPWMNLASNAVVAPAATRTRPNVA